MERLIASNVNRPSSRRDEMLDAIEVGLWYCDLPFDVLEWDATVKRHFWLPPDAPVTIDTFYERLHPDDRQRTRNAIECAIAESEARFRNMADNAPVVIWVTDSVGECVYLNREWYEFTGQTPAAALGFGWLDAVHPDDRAQAGAIFLEANVRRGPFSIDYRFRRADGVYRWSVDTATPRFSPTGEFLGYIGSVIDIHERTESEAERARLLEGERTARTEAERANRAKSDFLAVMSHELRTPLNAIDGYAELLELGVLGTLTPGHSEYVARIRRSQRHLLGLINSVLNFARIEAGHVHYDIGPVVVADLLAAAEPLMMPQLAARSLSYGFEAADPTLIVKADAEKVTQILLNLVSNAVKFTQPGGSVTVQAASAGEGSVTISVVDTGIGIPANRLDTIFDPFVQVDTTRIADLRASASV